MLKNRSRKTKITVTLNYELMRISIWVGFLLEPLFNNLKTISFSEDLTFATKKFQFPIPPFALRATAGQSGQLDNVRTRKISEIVTAIDARWRQKSHKVPLRGLGLL